MDDNPNPAAPQPNTEQTTPATDQPSEPAQPESSQQEKAHPVSQPDVPMTDDIRSHAKKILLVEDDDSLASVYETRLQAEGFTTKRVANGEDALAAATAYHPDLILLDVMMPKVSGFDVLDILRNTPETTNVKIIMLTALGQDSDRERAKNLGVDDYLVKSQVVIADVVEKIKEHLGI